MERRRKYEHIGEENIGGWREKAKIGGQREDAKNYMFTEISAVDIGGLRYIYWNQWNKYSWEGRRRWQSHKGEVDIDG